MRPSTNPAILLGYAQIAVSAAHDALLATLEQYEIGYDRAYIGARLHCLRCQGDELVRRLHEHPDLPEAMEEHYLAGIGDDEINDVATLADVVRLALDHERTAHGTAEHGSPASNLPIPQPRNEEP